MLKGEFKVILPPLIITIEKIKIIFSWKVQERFAVIPCEYLFWVVLVLKRIRTFGLKTMLFIFYPYEISRPEKNSPPTDCASLLFPSLERKTLSRFDIASFI